MDEGQIIGTTIAVLAGVAFLAGLIWLFATGRTPKWPEGEAKAQADLDGFTAVVIWGRGVAPAPLLAIRAVKAAAALRDAWAELERPPYKMQTFGVHVLADADFEATHPVGPKHGATSQAYLGSASQRLGDPPPMVVMRASLADHAMATGQPIIHELLHDIGALRYDREHETEGVWDMPGVPGVSVEKLASAVYAKR